MKTTIPIVVIVTAVVALVVHMSHGEITQHAEQPSPVPEGSFRVEVGDDMIPIDNTMVLSIKISVGPSDEDLSTRLQYRYLGLISVDTWAGGLAQTGTHDVLFTFQFGIAPGSGEPLVAYTTQQARNAVSSGVVPAAGKEKLDEVFRLTVHSGDYDLHKPLQIGTFGGEPVLLRVEPPHGWDQ